MNKRPNILLITSDQQLPDTLGVVNPDIRTPHLDRLAHEGVNFTRAYCPNPVCSPSRASIITGQYPSRHDCWTIGVKLPEDNPTLGDTLRRHGYHNSLIGKAHFQPLRSLPGSESLECQPTLRNLDYWRRFNQSGTPWYGFDHVELARNHADESHVGQHYAIWLEEKGLKNWREYFQPLPGESSPLAPPTDEGPGYGWREDMRWKLPAELHYTTWTAERSIAMIEQNHAQDRPFFCWASFHDPHPPYCVSEPWASMYDPADMKIGRYTDGEFDHMPPPHRLTREAKPDFSAYIDTGHGNHGYHSHLYPEDKLRAAQAVYYGMISFMDEQIGRILQKLDQLGIADNTIVVFTTDHGHFIGHHGLVAKGPFHYEELIRLPFVVRYPKAVPAGRTSPAIQSLVDLAPTFLDYADIETPGEMQGISQRRTWSEPDTAVRDWAMVENRHQHAAVHLRTFVTDRYKLTLYRDRDWGELFDLQEDPGEVHNRFDDPGYADVKSGLMQRFLNAELQREPTRMRRIAGA